MARQARIVIDNKPHHITQKGNRGEPIFFEKSDFQAYLDILREQCTRFDVKITSYCLLPNQIYLMAIPKEAKLLSRAIGETHRRYTNMINKRNDWRGHLFQDRFFSYVCDEQYTMRAIRMIENMPVVSKVAPKHDSYLWSSARSRIRLIHDDFLKNPVNFDAVPNWLEFLSRPMDEKELKAINTHLQTGRPRGNDIFLDEIEAQIGRTVRPKKRGRKPKSKTQNLPKDVQPKGNHITYDPSQTPNDPTIDAKTKEADSQSDSERAKKFKALNDRYMRAGT